MDISRRTFLALSAAAGAGLPLTRFGELAAAPTAPAAAKTVPICVFTKPLQWMDYDAVAGTAAEAGFDGLDIAVRPSGHVLPERVATDLPRAVEAAKRAGLVVPMITTEILDAHAPHSEEILKTAKALGIGYYRMGWYAYGDEHDPAGRIEELRPKVHDLAQLNAQYRIQGAYQNHVGGERVGGSVWDIYMLIRGEDPRWLGAQYDIRHATAEGGTTWPLGIELLRSYIRTTDIKDFHWEKRSRGWSPVSVPIGEGMVNWPAYYKLIRELGISGPVSVHFEYPPIEGKNDLAAGPRRKQAVELMKKDLARVREMRVAAGLEG
jgi:sugar phosphate isomerase/epimerase